jgi:hypothetical protein
MRVVTMGEPIKRDELLGIALEDIVAGEVLFEFDLLKGGVKVNEKLALVEGARDRLWESCARLYGLTKPEVSG